MRRSDFSQHQRGKKRCQRNLQEPLSLSASGSFSGFKSHLKCHRHLPSPSVSFLCSFCHRLRLSFLTLAVVGPFFVNLFSFLKKFFFSFILFQILFSINLFVFLKVSSESRDLSVLVISKFTALASPQHIVDAQNMCVD